MSDKHVTMKTQVVIEKPTGSKITYPNGAQALVSEDLADEWIADGKADPYPLPEEE